MHWAGSRRPTTFVSSTQLTAAISASDIAAAGTSNVTVVNAGSGGGPSNALQFTITSSGHSLNLNGSNGYAQVPHAAELTVVRDWTVERWFRDQASGAFNHDWKYLLTKGDREAAPESPYVLAVGYRQLAVGSRANWVDEVLTYDLVSNGVSATAWHHVAATLNASTRTMTLYLDGVLVAQGTLDHISSGTTMPIQIGRNGPATGKYWKGRIDDVRIWNVVRSAAQIQANYRRQLTSSPAELVGNWKFDEGLGSTAADTGGSPQTAALSSGATWSTDIGNQPPASDAAAPTFSSIKVAGITSSGATVAWNTNELADTAVEYGTSTSYGSTATPDTDVVSSHTVLLAGLNPSTTYQYRLRSRDASGNLALSPNFTFTTTAPGAPPGSSTPRFSLALSGNRSYADAPHAGELNTRADWTRRSMFKGETSGGLVQPCDCLHADKGRHQYRRRGALSTRYRIQRAVCRRTNCIREPNSDVYADR